MPRPSTITCTPNFTGSYKQIVAFWQRLAAWQGFPGLVSRGAASITGLAGIAPQWRHIRLNRQELPCKEMS
jgi:hypothetical protein